MNAHLPRDVKDCKSYYATLAKINGLHDYATFCVACHNINVYLTHLLATSILPISAWRC